MSIWSRTLELYGHTGDHISRIHRIAIFDEAETVHEFDLGDLACSMCLEVILDIGFGYWRFRSASADP
jgi:hypothetical protein